MGEILDLSLTELSHEIKTRNISPVEATEACLDRIAATESVICAYVCVLMDKAREAAVQAETEIESGNWKGPLHGVPVAVKDLFDLAGVPTTSSSKVRIGWTPDADSAAVSKLKDAGAVVLGKTQTHEFAAGISTPTTRNPWNRDRIPGGSSGGSGATVAGRGAFMALGTDTGGSIRIPAALCGTVGLKPTYGRISRIGITPLSWGMDHAGMLTRTVEDAATCLEALAGYDPRDPGSLDEPVPDCLANLESGVEGLRIGVPTNYFFDHIEPDVEDAVRTAHEQFASLGAELVEVALPLPEQIMAVQFGITLPEAAAYHRELLRERSQDYGKDVRMLLEAGEAIPATTYIRAMRVRNLLQQEFRKLYNDIDVIAAPTVPAVAIKAGSEAIEWADGTVEPITFLYGRLCSPANVTGIPSLSVPCGFSVENMPIGMQLIGRPLEEAVILQAGAAYEAVTEWHSRQPDFLR